MFIYSGLKCLWAVNVILYYIMLINAKQNYSDIYTNKCVNTAVYF
jgi:hypothetical protein